MCCAAPVQEFLQENPDAHQLFRPDVTPFSGLSVWLPDWMHTKCLGTDANLVGSALWYLIKEVMPEDAEANLATIWASVQSFYKAQKTKNRVSRLTLNMVKPEKAIFPKLSAKALETRDLIPAVEHLLRDWVGNPQCAWFHRLVFLSMKLDELVFSNKTCFLSLEDRDALRAGIFEYSQLLTKLAHFFHRRGKAFCNYTPKTTTCCTLGCMPQRQASAQGWRFVFKVRTSWASLRHFVSQAAGVSRHRNCSTKWCVNT